LDTLPASTTPIEGEDDRPLPRGIEVRRKVQRVSLGGSVLTLDIVNDFTTRQILCGRGSADDHHNDGAHRARFEAHAGKLWYNVHLNLQQNVPAEFQHSEG